MHSVVVVNSGRISALSCCKFEKRGWNACMRAISNYSLPPFTSYHTTPPHQVHTRGTYYQVGASPHATIYIHNIYYIRANICIHTRT